ncbi:hypothetical protein PR048_017167 [Dryococelus australis]|uniref:Uncharacterized protein n=1 Tax=Dryococelus australis TaxID=614101 RepID=A0ABQ9H8S3_9NEOP|nr:hypothetical protein PR048_017167 [Dryococelus australis]
MRHQRDWLKPLCHMNTTSHLPKQFRILQERGQEKRRGFLTIAVSKLHNEFNRLSTYDITVADVHGASEDCKDVTRNGSKSMETELRVFRWKSVEASFICAGAAVAERLTCSPPTEGGYGALPRHRHEGELDVHAGLGGGFHEGDAVLPGKPLAVLLAHHAVRTAGPHLCGGKTTVIVRLPPRRTGFNFRRGSSPDFHTWKSCRTMQMVGGFSFVESRPNIVPKALSASYLVSKALRELLTYSRDWKLSDSRNASDTIAVPEMATYTCHTRHTADPPVGNMVHETPAACHQWPANGPVTHCSTSGVAYANMLNRRGEKDAETTTQVPCKEIAPKDLSVVGKVVAELVSQLLTQQHDDHVVLRVLAYLPQPRADVVEARLVGDVVQQ